MKNRIVNLLEEYEKLRYRAEMQSKRAAEMKRIKAAVSDINGISQRGSEEDISSAIAALSCIAEQAEIYQGCYHKLAIDRANQERDQ